MARKPFKATVAAQVLDTGTGAMNIDGCRTGAREQTIVRGGRLNGADADPSRLVYGRFAHDDKIETFTYTKGRWPKNVVLEHLPGCEPLGERRVKASQAIDREAGKQRLSGVTYEGGQDYTQDYTSPGYAEADGCEGVLTWTCASACPVAELDRQSGDSSSSSRTRDNAARSGAYGVYGDRAPVPTGGHDDEGGASRFFPTFHPFIYQAKPSRAEKDAGLESLPAATGGEATGRQDGSAGLNSPRAGGGRTGGARNTHPTVKGIALMSWLVRLVTPPGGTLIDPFCGSGSTLVAAIREGFDCIGIDLDEDGSHLPIARARCEHAREIEPWELPLFADLAPAPEQASLFAPLLSPEGRP